MLAWDTSKTMRISRLRSLLPQIREAERYFSTTHTKEVRQIKDAYKKGNPKLVRELLDKLPTKDDLLRTLFESLKGKPVHKTLVKFLKEEKLDRATELKGLFSLGTHITIECQKGNKCYEILLPYVYEKIGSVLYSE